MSEKFRSLLKKNPNEIKKGLSDVLNQDSLDAIQDEIDSHVIALFKLGLIHYDFAKGLEARDWRHKISRFYYAGYNTARAIRLHYRGVFSTDAEDHKNINDIPDDFPNQEIYQADLPTLRGDRNRCDYDHLATEQDLVLGMDNTIALVEDFIRDAKSYLQTKGNITI